MLHSTVIYVNAILCCDPIGVHYPWHRGQIANRAPAERPVQMVCCMLPLSMSMQFFAVTPSGSTIPNTTISFHDRAPAERPVQMVCCMLPLSMSMQFFVVTPSGSTIHSTTISFHNRAPAEGPVHAIIKTAFYFLFLMDRSYGHTTQRKRQQRFLLHRSGR